MMGEQQSEAAEQFGAFLDILCDKSQKQALEPKEGECSLNKLFVEC